MYRVVLFPVVFFHPFERIQLGFKTSAMPLEDTAVLALPHIQLTMVAFPVRVSEWYCLGTRSENLAACPMQKKSVKLINSD